MEDIKKLASYLAQKGNLKQDVYDNTLTFFNMLKESGAELLTEINQTVNKDAKRNLEIQHFDSGKFEAELRFAGDSIVLQMHTNVFDFPEEHFVHKLPTVMEDRSKSFCGMILIYNFLADSIRYNRYADVGYLIGRIFVNKDGHFFMHGKRQFSFLYHDFEKQEINKKHAQNILLTAIKQAVDFDLYVPPFDAVKEINLQQKIVQMGNSAIKTGKRVGFVYNTHEED